MRTWLLLLCISATQLLATPVTPSTLAVGTAFVGFTSVFNTQTDGQLIQLSPTTYAPNDGTGATATVSLSAASTYGDLHASSSSSFNIPGPTPATGGALASAQFTDILTIDFAPWAGQPGLLNVNYTLDGSISSTGEILYGYGNGFATILERAGDPATGAFSYVKTQYYTSSTSGTFSIPPIPFIYGQPFFFTFGLFSGAGTYYDGAPGGVFCNCTATGQGSGSSQFFNTLLLTGLHPTDANGNPATGAVFISGSGTQYSTNGVVPEPSNLFLLATGVAGLSGYLRYRRHRQTTSSRPPTRTLSCKESSDI